MHSIVKFFKKTPFYYIFIHVRKYYSSIMWAFAGYPVAGPDVLKSNVVKEYGEKFNVKIFIETGTYLGQMIEDTKGNFDKILSIELDKKLFEQAKNRFSGSSNVTILQGDSSLLLPKIIYDFKEPILFWLDAHYSAGFTTKGSTNTPIMAELESILGHPYNNEHVILIDDARCFNGDDDYPTISEIKRLINERNPNLILSEKDDIIRIHKKLP